MINGLVRTIAGLALLSLPAYAETSKQADEFVDSIGVQTHIANTGNYTDLFSTWVNRVQTSGIRHIRDGFWFQADSNKAQTLMSTILAATGTQVKFLLTQGANCTDATVNSPTEYVGWGWTPAQISGFEGMNEIGPAQGYCGSNPSPTWYQQFANDAAFLRTTVAGMAGGFASIPVVTPSLNEYGRYNSTDLSADAALIGDITANIDYSTLHIYCTHGQPTCANSAFPSSMTAAFGTKPFIISETGYTTVPGGGDGTEAQTGNYYSRLFFEFFNHGAKRVYAYALLDDTSATGGLANFGLLHADASPKPAYTVISNTIAILSDPGAPFTPGNLDFTISNPSGQTLNHTLLQKRDGTFYLAMWLAYNYSDTFSPASVTVNLPSNFSASWYNPLSSASVAGYVPSTNSVNLTISDSTTILALGAAVPGNFLILQ